MDDDRDLHMSGMPKLLLLIVKLSLLGKASGLGREQCMGVVSSGDLCWKFHEHKLFLLPKLDAFPISSRVFHISC